MRDQQAKIAAKHAYRAAKRRPRAIIYQRELEVQRLRADGTPVRDHSTTVMHLRARPITWAQAREQGRAYARVLDGKDAHPSESARAKMKADNVRAAEARQTRAKHGVAERFKRPANGLWWANKFADAVERRETSGVPKYANTKVLNRKRDARAHQRKLTKDRAAEIRASRAA